MADEAVVTQAPATSTPASPGFTMPEKFVGKSVEDVAKSYAELESKYGEISGRVREYDEYSKIGQPKDISEALEWARNMKAALDRGMLVPRDQVKSEATATAPSKDPWDEGDWAYKTPAEQFKILNERVQANNKTYIDGLYQNALQQIQGITTQDARQKQILLRAISSAIKNPGLDPETILTEAAEMSTKTPEELMDMVLAARAQGPETFEKRVLEETAKRQAEWIQAQEAKQMADISAASSMPRGLGARLQSKNLLDARNNENKQIFDSLNKQGIKLVS